MKNAGIRLKTHSQTENKLIWCWKANAHYLRFNFLKKNFRASEGWRQWLVLPTSACGSYKSRVQPSKSVTNPLRSNFFHRLALEKKTINPSHLHFPQRTTIVSLLGGWCLWQTVLPPWKKLVCRPFIFFRAEITFSDSIKTEATIQSFISWLRNNQTNERRHVVAFGCVKAH
jgi:hypothetical protein